MTRKNIIADIRYNPYAVLIAHMDAESFFRLGGDISAFSKANDVFTHECEKYHRGLRKNLADFAPYAGYKGLENNLEFASFLFNPVCIVGFGDADNIAFVAMDEFDLAMRLISRTNLPIHQTILWIGRYLYSPD